MSTIKKFTRASLKDRASQFVVYVTDDYKVRGVQLEGWAIAEDMYSGADVVAPVVYSRFRDTMHVASDLASETATGSHSSEQYGRAVLGVFTLMDERTGLAATDEMRQADHIQNVVHVLNSHGTRTGDAAWVELIAKSELGERLAKEWWERDGKRIKTTWADGSGPNGEPRFEAATA